MRPRMQLLVFAVLTAMLPCSASAGPSTTSEAPAAAASSHRVRLSIETSAMGDEAKSTQAWVQRDGTAALAEAGIAVDPKATAEVRVILAPEDLGYTVTIEVREDGQPQPLASRGPKLCETCTRTELVGLVGRELAWVGGWLSTSPVDETATEGKADATPEDDGPDPEADLEQEPEPAGREQPPRRLHALGWAGVGLGAVGVGTLASGIAIGVRTYEARGEAGDYRTPRAAQPERIGWAMVGLGAAAAVGGTVMVVLDLVRPRPRPLAAAPWLDGQAAGLWVRRRF
ncbi:MAG: hypothetical protein KDK70_36490 [Myxococcales bacterium]|nr:hypothetical protein [Myxococcales bacterium]